MMLQGDVSPLVIRLFGPFEVSLHAQPPARLKLRRGQWALALGEGAFRVAWEAGRTMSLAAAVRTARELAG